MNLFGVQSHLYKKISGDSIDLFLVFQVERKTVMTICFKEPSTHVVGRFCGMCLLMQISKLK